MHKFSHLWWKSLDGKFENIAQSTHYGGGQEHRLWVMPYVAKRRLENEKTLKKEASKCKKINSFFTKSSWETRGEECGEGDPCISASLEETGDITTTSGVTTTPEPLTLTPSSNSEKNTDNTFHSFSQAVSQPCEQSCSTSSNNTDESNSACQF